MVFRLVRFPSSSADDRANDRRIYVAETELNAKHVRKLLGRDESGEIENYEGLILRPSSELLLEILRTSGHSVPTPSELGYLESSQLEHEARSYTDRGDLFNPSKGKWAIWPSKTRPRGVFGLYDIAGNLPEYCFEAHPRTVREADRGLSGAGPIGHFGTGHWPLACAWGVRLVHRESVGVAPVGND